MRTMQLSVDASHITETDTDTSGCLSYSLSSSVINSEYNDYCNFELRYSMQLVIFADEFLAGWKLHRRGGSTKNTVK